MMEIVMLISFFIFVANPMNPDLSANGLFLFRKGSKSSTMFADKPNGFSVQEIETRLSSTVDPYFRGEFTLSFESEIDPATGDQEFHFHPEEAYAETISLPSVTLRAGKFKAFLGRHNQMHTHAWAFVDQPLSYDRILGEEGLNEIGASAAFIAPTPWYLEIVGQALSARNDLLFDKNSADDVAGIFYLKNLFDVNAATSFELNGTYGIGNNDLGAKTQLFDAASVVKWKPLAQSNLHSVSWTTEWLHAQHQQGSDAEHNEAGVSSWVQWQLLKRWWLQGRGELFMASTYDNVETKKASGLIGFVPTEYSAVRAQYDASKNTGAEVEHRVSLQLNISIGAHPAHAY